MSGTRIAAGVEYDGTAYSGWQIQKDADSIQARLEAALSAVADHPVATICAGRTDAGVHATGQVVHFDTDAVRDRRNWMLGVNSNLPPDINLRWVMQVDPEFHARFGAIERRYRYLILNREFRSALWRDRATWVHRPLDADAMADAATRLVGKHDFSAFRSVHCQAHSPMREIRQLAVERRGELIQLTVAADAFLHHMVRNIAGTLMVVGRGEAEVSWVTEVLEGRDREQAGATAPAAGLYLDRVTYPERFGLPAAAGSSTPL